MAYIAPVNCLFIVRNYSPLRHRWSALFEMLSLEGQIRIQLTGTEFVRQRERVLEGQQSGIQRNFYWPAGDAFELKPVNRNLKPESVGKANHRPIFSFPKHRDAC